MHKKESCLLSKICPRRVTNRTSKKFSSKSFSSSQDTEEVLHELDKDEQKAKENIGMTVQNLKSELADISAKLDKLLSAYLDEIISAEEYSAQKQKLLSRKVEFNEEIREIEDKGTSWLEPARAWVKSLNQAGKLLSSGDKSEMTTFLKQIGSNHILIDKSFFFLPKSPLKIRAGGRGTRREVELSCLQNSNWRCILKIARTEFARRTERGSYGGGK